MKPESKQMERESTRKESAARKQEAYKKRRRKEEGIELKTCMILPENQK